MAIEMMSESAFVPSDAGVVSDSVEAEKAVETTTVEKAVASVVRLKGEKQVLKWLGTNATYLALDVDARRPLEAMLIVDRPTIEDAIQAVAEYQHIVKPARAERSASTGGEGTRGPREIQPPMVDGAEKLHKIYHVELHGVFMVGHANTAKGWVTRNLTALSVGELHGDLKAGKAKAIEFALAETEKILAKQKSKAARERLVADVKAEFERQTTKDGSYGLVAHGRNARMVNVAAE